MTDDICETARRRRPSKPKEPMTHPAPIRIETDRVDPFLHQDDTEFATEIRRAHEWLDLVMAESVRRGMIITRTVNHGVEITKSVKL